MLPLYEETKGQLNIFLKKSKHVPPHLHKSIECIYVTEGSLELGVGQELHHMEQGDFAIVFPELIHHYQVFETGKNKAYYLLALPPLVEGFAEKMQKYCPENPVIDKKDLHPDIPYALQSLVEIESKTEKENAVIRQAYFQIILARSMPRFQLREKSAVGSDDIIYKTVSYIAAHFRESISLTTMAWELGVSPYALSRVFSGTFHMNFNQYINGTRLDYACALLEHTDQSITDVCMNAGFESQRTFNRVFMERFHMTPREYRKGRK